MREALQTKLDEIRRKFNANEIEGFNEATTRLVIIDEILVELGWDKKEFNPEQSSGAGGFLDYLLTIDRIPTLIVEAKRSGVTFKAPGKSLGKVQYPVTYLKSSFGPALTQVIKQAEDYAYSRRVPFALLSNGIDWLLLQVIPTPGLPLSKMQGFYFGNILQTDFQTELFFELCSKLGFLAGVPQRRLAELNQNRSDFVDTVAARIGPWGWRPPSSSTHRFLHDFYHHFFDDIIDEGRREMLEKCFVASSELNNYEADLKRVLKDVAPSYWKEHTTFKDLNPGSQDEILAAATGDKKGTVVLITGSVGAGKSTFVTRVRISKRNDNTTHFLVLDLIDESTFSDVGVGERLYAQVAKKWREKFPTYVTEKSLKQIFHAELEELRKGPRAKVLAQDSTAALVAEAELLEASLADHEVFIEKSWQYFRRERKNLILVLDNVDRNSEDYQKSVYSFAHHVAQRSGATVIITMRESTFFRGQRKGFLDVRKSDRVFHLEAPDLVQVVSARVNYVQNHLADDLRMSTWKRAEDSEARFEAYALFAETVKISLLAGADCSVNRNLLAATAWHNVREFFSLVHRTHTIIGCEEKPWSASEVLAALSIEMGHDPNRGHLPNIFEPPESASRAYLFRSRVLALLIRGVRSNEARHGVEFKRLDTLLSTSGYSEREIRVGVRNMVRDRLLECVDVPSEMDFTAHYDVSPDHSYRASPLGVVILKSVLSAPAYIGAVGYSVPIHSDEELTLIMNGYESLLSLAGEAPLDRHVLSLLADDSVYRPVAQYLLDAVSSEQIVSDAISPAVQNVERYIEEHVMLPLRDLLSPNESALPVTRSVARETNQPVAQLGIFDRPINVVETRLQVPFGIENMRIGTSKYAPKIFWALHMLLLQGRSYVTGSEIAQVINQHLVEDELAPPNVSRALRGEELLKQPWLSVSYIGKRPRFSLSNGWELHWRKVFEVDSNP